MNNPYSENDLEFVTQPTPRGSVYNEFSDQDSQDYTKKANSPSVRLENKSDMDSIGLLYGNIESRNAHSKSTFDKRKHTFNKNDMIKYRNFI